jgi:hypothetical protein
MTAKEKLKKEVKKPAMKDRGNLTQKMRDAFIAQAQTLYHDEGTCEIDAHADVSYVSLARGGGGGAYVQAWVWVPVEAVEG